MACILSKEYRKSLVLEVIWKSSKMVSTIFAPTLVKYAAGTGKKLIGFSEMTGREFIGENLKLFGRWVTQQRQFKIKILFQRHELLRNFTYGSHILSSLILDSVFEVLIYISDDSYITTPDVVVFNQF